MMQLLYSGLLTQHPRTLSAAAFRPGARRGHEASKPQMLRAVAQDAHLPAGRCPSTWARQDVRAASN